MKNTVITARRKKIELLTLLVCFIIGNLANLYAIISYKTLFVCALCLLDPIATFILRNKKFVP